MEPEIVSEIVPAELIRVVQSPAIAENLIAVKQKWQQSAEEALAMVCTEDTVKAVKAMRAEMEKEFTELDERRKDVKKSLLKPYEEVLMPIFTDCVLKPHSVAKDAYDKKIFGVESAIKQRCEDGLRDYFAELREVHHLPWLTYEQAGIKVDMASAKAKTPTKLRRQLEEFVVGVSDSVDRINLLEDASEIMVEYQRTLDAADAICTVQERHQCIEEQKAAQEARKAEQDLEVEMVRRVEALAPPVVVKEAEKDPNEVIPRLTFTCVNATRAQLRRVREFLNMEGIEYE